MAKMLGIEFSYSRTLLQMSIVCMQGGRFSQARSIAQAVADFRPDLPQPRCAVASSYLGEQRYQEAANYLERILQEFPDCQLAKCLLANSLFNLGKTDTDRLLTQVIEDGRDRWAIEYANKARVLHSKSPKRVLPARRAPTVGTARSIMG